MLDKGRGRGRGKRKRKEKRSISNTYPSQKQIALKPAQYPLQLGWITSGHLEAASGQLFGKGRWNAAFMKYQLKFRVLGFFFFLRKRECKLDNTYHRLEHSRSVRQREGRNVVENENKRKVSYQSPLSTHWASPAKQGHGIFFFFFFFLIAKYIGHQSFCARLQQGRNISRILVTSLTKASAGGSLRASAVSLAGSFALVCIPLTTVVQLLTTRAAAACCWDGK